MSRTMSRSLNALVAVTSLILLAALPAEARRRGVAHRPPPFNVAFTEGGYADKTSVRQGDTIRFHIATSVSPFSLRIVNLANREASLMTRTLNGATRNCSGRAAQGCDTPRTMTLDVPTSWPSGYYAAFFPTAFGERSIIFVVRAANPSSFSDTVIISPTNTYQAFNDYGGKGLYPDDDPNRAATLTFNRPYNQENGLGRFPIWEEPFLHWMTETGRRYEVLTDTDLETPNALTQYRLVVIVGQSSYWTAAARAQLEEFSRNGGHVAVFGGNSMWWQVRLADDNRTIIALKSLARRFDLIGDVAPELVTTNWHSAPVNRPENNILGASFRNGGYANRVDIPNVYELKPLEQRIPWSVADASSWVFAGTSVGNGTTFGRSTTGLEVDGVVFNCSSSGQVLGPDGSDETPRNYHVAAITPASDGWGTMGYYVNPAGGVVFNAATQNWTLGLDDDPVVRIVTGNVLDRLGTGARMTYDAPQDAVLAQDLFNCSHPTLTLPGWVSAGPRGATTAACAYEGPFGLELSGAVPVTLARAFAPVSAPRDHVELRFYLNVDAVPQRAALPIPLVSLRQRNDTATTQVAVVELDTSTPARRIRIARRGPDGFAASPEWISLSNGWHLVEASWRSPGTIELQVDGGTKVSLSNPHAGQKANEMVLEYPTAESTNAGRICIDAIGAGSAKMGSVPPGQ